jgi:hypothetical protein
VKFRRRAAGSSNGAVGLVAAAALACAGPAEARVSVGFGPVQVGAYELSGGAFNGTPFDSMSVDLQKRVNRNTFRFVEQYSIDPGLPRFKASWSKRSASIRLSERGIRIALRFTPRGNAFVDRHRCRHQAGVLKGKFVVTRFKRRYRTISTSSFPADLVNPRGRPCISHGAALSGFSGPYPRDRSSRGVRLSQVVASTSGVHLEARTDAHGDWIHSDYGHSARSGFLADLWVQAKKPRSGRVILSGDAKSGKINGFGPISGNATYTGTKFGKRACNVFSSGSVSGDLKTRWDLVGNVRAILPSRPMSAALTGPCP